ncbi:uncharacterized protein [Nicotiana tomentosiformis]|uniref:uncharacterized protein n=1 Tax=Nicotiana tomentosiformis TaxID=4098 RepID=UPI00388C77D2
MKMDVPKKERSLSLRIAEGSDLEDDEMDMITKDFKKYLKRGKNPLRSGSCNKPKALESQTNEGCYKCDDEDGYEQALMAIEESDEESELSKERVVWKAKCKNLELRVIETISENTALKNQEHHSSNRRGLDFGNMPPKWDPKSKYLTFPENKICTHCGKTGHYKSECNTKEKVQVKGSSQIWYMDSGYSKHMTGSKNQFLFTWGPQRSLISGKRVNNIYIVDLSTLSENKLTCLSVLDNDPLLWNKGLGHASLSQLNKLVSKDLVIGLPNIKFKEDKVCESCPRGKQVRSSFKCKKVVSTTGAMELVHKDLCGPMRTLSRGGKRYVMVLIDDYSMFTWTLLLTSKDEAFSMFISFVRKTQKQLGNQLASIRSDHGIEFENAKFTEFCDEHGIDHNFSPPRLCIRVK